MVGLLPEAVGQMAEQEAGQRDAAHGRVLKRSGGRQAEMERFDDFGNDDADRIGGHGEHHEHDERQGFYGGQVLAVSSAEPPPGRRWCDSEFVDRAPAGNARWTPTLFSDRRSAAPIRLRAATPSDGMIVTGQQVEIACECGVRVAETDQFEKRAHDRALQLIVQFGGRVVVAIDVAADAGAAQQVEIVRSRQQTGVIDLRHAGREELKGARNQIFVVACAEGIVKSAIDLVQIEIAGRGAGGLAARALAAFVNRFHEGIDLFGRQAGREVRPALFRVGPTSSTPIPS